MEASQVKENLGKEVILNDPYQQLENVPCIFRALRLYVDNGRLFRQAELESLNCGHSVIYTHLDNVQVKPAETEPSEETDSAPESPAENL